MSTSKLECTVGAFIRKMENVCMHLSEFSNYQPLNPKVSIAALEDLVQRLVQANKSEAQQLASYYLLAEQRRSAFKKDVHSVEKVLTLINSNVISLMGKDSKASQMVAAQIRDMRGAVKKTKAEAAKAVVPPVVPSAPAVPVPGQTTNSVPTVTPAPAKKVRKKPSQSHKSYASLTFSFLDLIEILKTFPYQSDNPELELAQLENFGLQLKDLNNQVDLANSIHERCLQERNACLEEAKERLSRVKSYVKVRYGAKSWEYGEVK